MPEAARKRSRKAVLPGFGWQATMLLCDAAEVADGKLFILGGGWSVVGMTWMPGLSSPVTSPMALAIKVDVPWAERDKKHTFRLELLNADLQPHMVSSPGGQVPLVVQGTFEVSRKLGIPEVVALPAVFTVTFGPMQLAPESRYIWRLRVHGLPDPLYDAWFLTGPVSAPGTPPGLADG
jgi:hypothetical protein